VLKTTQLQAAFDLYKATHHIDHPVRPSVQLIVDDDEDPFGELNTQPESENEIQTFFQMPLADRNEDIILWWKRNASCLPVLSGLARIYLAIPATSTPSERVFSTAGNLISEKRTSLSCDSVQAGMALKSWRDAGLID